MTCSPVPLSPTEWSQSASSATAAAQPATIARYRPRPPGRAAAYATPSPISEVNSAWKTGPKTPRRANSSASAPAPAFQATA